MTSYMLDRITLCVSLIFLFVLPIQAQRTFIEQGKLNGVLPLDESQTVTYEVVKTVEGISKDRLYMRARKWFVKTYNSVSALQINDATTGELTGHGVFPIKAKIVRVWFNATVDHTLIVELRDGRYRITLTNLKINNQPGKLNEFRLPYIGPTESQYTTFYHSIDDGANQVIASLEKALLTSDEF